MVFVYTFWGLAAVALAGSAADVIALRRHVAKRAALAALILKGVVVLGFAAWWAALRLELFGGWGDLTTFAGLIVVSVPLLGATLVCDVVALRAVLHARS